MNELKIIDNEVVPVYETDSQEKIVDGRELHRALESKQDFSTWMKKRLFESDAVENTDYCRFHKKMEANNATSIEYYLKLDIAKEIAMLERNEVGKKVRKRFIEIEKRYSEQIIDRTKLSPQTQLMMSMSDAIAKTELEQIRQAEEIARIKENQTRLEEKQNTIAETFSSPSDSENFQLWANKCISRIAESPNFHPEYGRQSRYALARNESYARLKKKWNCNLDDRVARAKGRAVERNPGITKAELNAINKLTIIANDKSLRPVYETVLKEMMIQYCVEVPA